MRYKETGRHRDNETHIKMIDREERQIGKEWPVHTPKLPVISQAI